MRRPQVLPLCWPLLLSILGFLHDHVIDAYTIRSPSLSTKRGHQQQLKPDSLTTRSDFFGKICGVVATLPTLLVAGPIPAQALDSFDPDRALRTVRASQRKLSSTAVATMVNESDYPALQSLLRQPPVSDIRKACSQLAKDDAALQARYQTFIAALERMDTTALVAQRGRKIGEFELLERYNDVVAALGEFVDTASATVSPVVEG